MYDYRSLRGLIRAKFNTQEAFAEALGVSLVTVSHKLNGKIGFSQGDVIKWSKLLGISADEYGHYFFTQKV